MEQLRLDWLANSIGVECSNPITVASLPSIIKDLRCQGTKYGSALDYYESMHLINIQAFESFDINSIHIDLVPVDDSAGVTIFVFTDGSHKVIYAPCDVKPFPENDIFMDADCLIIGNTIVGDVLKDGFILEKNNPLRDELFVLDEIVELKEKYNIKRVIITHLEEDWGKSHDDYINLQKQLDGIEFAYDGLEIGGSL
jgi:Metal-dependent hydrolases of the beta-lactamase superfamily I